MVKFYFVLLLEAILFPVLYIKNALKKKLSKLILINNSSSVHAVRIIENEIIYAVHEWAGYSVSRKKTIKYIDKVFTCGLKFQLERMFTYNGKYRLRRIITISDFSKKYFDEINQNGKLDNKVEIIPVLNSAMDFSGYSYICHQILNTNYEQVVFLTNTSVDNDVTPFIDEYVDLFKRYSNLGLVGVSYSTKIYQTLIKNNFNPHLQSFFLVSKTSVLKDVIAINGGSFPGEKETYKLSIIRFGEAKLTKLVKKLGYDIGLITENGELVFFPKENFWSNGYSQWSLHYGDYRLSNRFPNRINIIK